MKRTINQLGLYGVLGSVILGGVLSGCIGAPMEEDPEGLVSEATEALTDGTTYVFTSTQGTTTLALGGAKWSRNYNGQPQLTGYSSNGRADEFWTVNTIDATWFQLINAWSGLCLESNGLYSYAHTVACNTSATNQRWTLESGTNRLKAYNGYYIGTAYSKFASDEDLQMQTSGSGLAFTATAKSPPGNQCPSVTTTYSFSPISVNMSGSSYKQGSSGSVSYAVYDLLASGNMTLLGQDDAFSASWGANNADFLARAGLGFSSPKTAGLTGNIFADFNFSWSNTNVRSGGGGVAVYGWFLSGTTCANSTDLAEYYIVEAPFGELSVPAASSTVTRYTDSFIQDGDIYSVYTVHVAADPNRGTICGNNKAFDQYFSVRHVPRTCGTVTVHDHFQKWYDLGIGLNPGVTLGYVTEARMLVESFGATAASSFKFNQLNVHQ